MRQSHLIQFFIARRVDEDDIVQSVFRSFFRAATAGLYDDSGKWLYHTGLPAKSGVGGGVIAVAPGKYGIAAVSPPLDGAGNSVRAQRAIEEITRALQLNPYASKPSRSVTQAAEAAPSR